MYIYIYYILYSKYVNHLRNSHPPPSIEVPTDVPSPTLGDLGTMGTIPGVAQKWQIERLFLFFIWETSGKKNWKELGNYWTNIL